MSCNLFLLLKPDMFYCISYIYFSRLLLLAILYHHWWMIIALTMIGIIVGIHCYTPSLFSYLDNDFELLLGAMALACYSVFLCLTCEYHWLVAHISTSWFTGKLSENHHKWWQISNFPGHFSVTKSPKPMIVADFGAKIPGWSPAGAFV